MSADDCAPDSRSRWHPESIVFGFMVFESREHRDEVQAAVSEDPAYQALFEDGMPFDPARMTTGSFRSIVSDED